MFAEVTRTRTSVGRSIRASGTSLTLTCRGPSYTTAFMLASSSRWSHRGLGSEPSLDTAQPAAGIGRDAHTGREVGPCRARTDLALAVP